MCAAARTGLPSTHPLRGPELRALREVLRDYHPKVVEAIGGELV
jgi:hypothetical protein